MENEKKFLGIVEINEAKRLKELLKRQGVGLDIEFKDKTCKTGCSVTVELWGIESDIPKIQKFMDTEKNKLLEGHEYDKELELHIFYGFNNIEKMIRSYPYLAKMKENIEEQTDQNGVFWHGRIGQKQLYREFLKSGIWCYPTEFFETSCRI